MYQYMCGCPAYIPYLVDLFLGMRQQAREVLEGLAIEHSLRLVVRARNDVANCAQRSRL